MTPELPFAELMRRVRAGDQEASAELVRRYEPEIRRFIRLHLTDPRLRRHLDSIDIFQSVFGNFFVRLMGGQFDLEEPSQLLRLLVTMARHKIIDHARRPANRQDGGQTTVWEGVADPGDSPSDIVAQEELLREMQRRLTDEERTLAELRTEGRSWDEIAGACGGTPDGAHKKLERALERVCRELGLGEVSDA
jgi:RNA polymerase sigma-70 factor (ECF subfamily)